MVIRRTDPRYPRRGPSCLFVLFVVAVFALGVFVVANAEEVRETIIAPPTPEPTRSAADFAVSAALLARDGEYDEAIDAYQQAVTLDSGRIELYVPLMELLTLTGRAEEALQWGIQARELDETNEALLVALAAAYLAYGDRLAETGDPAGAELQYAEAVRVAREATELNPNNAEAYAYQAGALASLGPDRYAQAQEMAQIAIELEPNNPVVNRNMAIVLEVQGLYESAIEQYLLALEQDPPNAAELYIGLAYNLYAVRNIPEAILTFQQALDVDPENADAYEGLGYMYFLIGEYPSAQENLEKAVSLDGEMVRGHAHLGAAHFRQFNYELAIRELETAIGEYDSVTHANAPYFTMLGLAYFRTNQDCTRAVPIFESVLAVVPDDTNAQEGIDLCHAVELQSP